MHDFKSFQFYEVKIYKLKDRKLIRKKKSFDLLINVAKMHVGVWEFTFFHFLYKDKKYWKSSN